MTREELLQRRSEFDAKRHAIITEIRGYNADYIAEHCPFKEGDIVIIGQDSDVHEHLCFEDDNDINLDIAAIRGDICIIENIELIAQRSSKFEFRYTVQLRSSGKYYQITNREGEPTLTKYENK